MGEHQHQQRYDGDDPYLICECGARWDAISGRPLNVAAGADWPDPTPAPGAPEPSLLAAVEALPTYSASAGTHGSLEADAYWRPSVSLHAVLALIESRSLAASRPDDDHLPRCEHGAIREPCVPCREATSREAGLDALGDAPSLDLWLLKRWPMLRDSYVDYIVRRTNAGLDEMLLEEACRIVGGEEAPGSWSDFVVEVAAEYARLAATSPAEHTGDEVG